MRFVALIEPGPKWQPGTTIFEQGEAVTAHLAAMAVLYDTGQLLLGGPFSEGRSGLAVLEAGTETDARALMDADPAVRAGVFKHALHGLRPYFDAVSGTRMTGRRPAGAPTP